MYNADGSESEMCGNACGASRSTSMTTASGGPITRIQTGRGILAVDLEVKAGKVDRVRVNMGEPIVEGAKIRRLAGNPPLDATDSGWANAARRASDKSALRHLRRERDGRTGARPGTKNRIRAGVPSPRECEFIEVLANGSPAANVERGSGETLACGTGRALCASPACSLTTERRDINHLRGGDLS
jgi:diaminopimelate epimerase